MLELLEEYLLPNKKNMCRTNILLILTLLRQTLLRGYVGAINSP